MKEMVRKGRGSGRTFTAGAFGIPLENDNVRRVVELCAERGCVWVTRTLSTKVCVRTQGGKTKWT